jgi:hypothetical protein
MVRRLPVLLFVALAECSPAPRTTAPALDRGESVVVFNHAFAAVDAETVEALASSDDVRAVGATESRTTTGTTGTWSGFYLYGRETFLEFLAPSADHREGSTGVGLQVENVGALDALARRLAAAKYPLEANEQSMKLPEGRTIPWFRYLTPAGWPDAAAIDVWVAENHSSFMAYRLAPRAVDPNDVSRRTYLSTKYAPERLLENVVAVGIRAPEADRDRFGAAMTAFGWRTRRDGASVIAEHGDATVTVTAGAGPAGFTELRLALTRDAAPRDVRVGRSTLTLGPGRTARWTFDP